MRKNLSKLSLLVLLSALILFTGVKALNARQMPCLNLVGSPCGPVSEPSWLIIGLDATSPRPQINYVDINNGSPVVPMLVFDANNPDSNTITSLTISHSESGTHPTGYHLFDGDTELSYQAWAPGPVTFDYLNSATEVPWSIYTIRADMPAHTLNGSQASVSFISMTYIDSVGQPEDKMVTCAGYTQYFYNATPQLSFVSASASVNNRPDGTTASAQASFNFTVTPYPGQAMQYGSNGSDFTIVAKGGPSNNSTTVTSKSLVFNNITPTNGRLAAGQQYNISLSGVISNLPAGIYSFYITSASSTVQDANGTWVSINQTVGLDNFHTQSVAISSANFLSGAKGK